MAEQPVKCKYCDNEARFHITAIKAGRSETHHVCEAHASADDGVVPPMSCPQCGGPMESICAWQPEHEKRNQAKWMKTFLNCPTCGHQMEPPTGKPEL